MSLFKARSTIGLCFVKILSKIITEYKIHMFVLESGGGCMDIQMGMQARLLLADCLPENQPIREDLVYIFFKTKIVSIYLFVNNITNKIIMENYVGRVALFQN